MPTSSPVPCAPVGPGTVHSTGDGPIMGGGGGLSLSLLVSLPHILKQHKSRDGPRNPSPSSVPGPRGVLNKYL